MALKDWKKVYNMKNKWQKKYYILTIRKIGKFYHAYIIDLRTNLDTEEGKAFRRLKDAKEFSKKYMRSH